MASRRIVSKCCVALMLFVAGCAVDNTKVIANGECTHVIKDGIYARPISSGSFPQGATVCAQSDGGVVFTGRFEPQGFNMRGIVAVGNTTKVLSGGTFERMSFIGGPTCGNTVNTAVGDHTTVRDSVFFGRGGRYLLLAYQAVNVRIENAIFRYDGGWGETEACSEYEPNAVLNFYDTSGAICDGCVNIDQRPTAASNSEILGGLGVNAHTSDLCYGVRIENSVDANSSYFWADGNGRCNPEFDRVRGGFNLNLAGTVLIRRSSGGFCNTWRGAVEASTSIFEEGNCANRSKLDIFPELDWEFVDDPRWRQEMCGTYSQREDGWCNSNLSLSDYLNRWPGGNLN